MSTHQHKPTANKTIGGVQYTKGRDPSNTAQIQIEFIKELQRRFKRVRGRIRNRVGYQNDALTLRSNADETDVFLTDPEKVDQFIKQLREWLREEVLEIVDPIRVQNGQHWTRDYLQNAYVAGAQTAQGRLMQAGVSLTADGSDEILERAVSVRQLQDIYTRAFENLQGITDDMAREVRTTLTRGIAEGWNPKKMASELNREIRSMTRTRAVTLARTETIHSHTEATLNEYERAGVDGVSHTSRMHAHDDDVCLFCRVTGGETYTLREFRDVSARFQGSVYRLAPPSHPNCRCSPMPAMGVGELPPLEERVPGTILSR